MLITTFFFRIGGSIHGYLLSETHHFLLIDVITDFHSEWVFLYPRGVFEGREQTKLDIFHHHLLSLRGVTAQSDTLKLRVSEDWGSIFARFEQSGEIIGIEWKSDTAIYELGIVTGIDRSGVSLRVFDEFGVWRVDEAYVLFKDIFVIIVENEYLRVLWGYAREHIGTRR